MKRRPFKMPAHLLDTSRLALKTTAALWHAPKKILFNWPSEMPGLAANSVCATVFSTDKKRLKELKEVSLAQNYTLEIGFASLFNGRVTNKHANVENKHVGYTVVLI